MSKIIALLLIATLSLTLCACGKKDTQSSSEKSTSSATDNPSFEEYVGTWSKSDMKAGEGNLVLNISVIDKEMEVECTATSYEQYPKIAGFTKLIDLSQIKNNSVEIAYDDDNWGNSGILELTFGNEAIFACFKNVVLDEYALWGCYEGNYKLVQNGELQDFEVQDDEDYLEGNPQDGEDYPEGNPTSQDISYDTSKSSGVLASMNLTVDQFKEQCVPLLIGISDSKYHFLTAYKTQADKWDYKYGVDHFSEFNFALNEEFSNAKKAWDNNTGNVQKYYKDYNEYLEIYIYPKMGERYIKENHMQVAKDMCIYPDNYVGKPYVFRDFAPVNYSGDVIHKTLHYYNNTMNFYDMRDNTTSPNISKSENYNLYTIFLGTSRQSNGSLALDFGIIALDLISD